MYAVADERSAPRMPVTYSAPPMESSADGAPDTPQPGTSHAPVASEYRAIVGAPTWGVDILSGAIDEEDT